MTCLRCQTIDVAVACGTEEQLIRELYRQIERLETEMHTFCQQFARSVQRDHDATVARLQELEDMNVALMLLNEGLRS